jgi:predicted ABC-type ATPase
MTSPFDSRPIIVAVAGPNGAGKSTFYEAHLKPAGLRFVNADDFAREIGIEAYEAARVAESIRRELFARRESFVFETVFSDPSGDKIEFLVEAARAGYSVVLCFIGVPDVETSEERVAMRVLQGGHDVPTEKLVARFPRTLSNLDRAMQELPVVLVFDNGDLGRPFHKVAEIRDGQVAFSEEKLPAWLTLPPNDD